MFIPKEDVIATEGSRKTYIKAYGDLLRGYVFRGGYISIPLSNIYGAGDSPPKALR